MIEAPTKPSRNGTTKGSVAAGVDVSRLCRAIDTSKQVLRKYCSERREIVRQMVGGHWSEDGASKTVPVNLLAMYSAITSRSLVPKEPRVMLSTFNRQARPLVGTMQSWMNQRIEQIGLAETLQRWVQDALILVGIVKVALASPSDAALSSWSAPAGQPFAEVVDLDDFAFDVGATRMRDSGFFAHRIRVPLDAAREYYGRKGKTRLTPSSVAAYNPGTGEEKVSNLGRGSRASAEEFEDMTDLWEVYLPRHKLVMCLATDESGVANDVPLEVKKWLGPSWGPYHFLGYSTVPGNALPKGPMLDLVDIHMCYNRLMRKLMAQAERQKVNLAVKGGVMDDAGRLVQSSDGEMIKYEGEFPQEIVWGGANPANVAFVDILRNLFSWAGGNLDIQGGLSPQSKTASQDSMLNQNATLSVADKQDMTIRAIGGVLRSLGWFWYHHPQQVMKTKWNPPGMPEISTTRELYPFNPALKAQGMMTREVPWEELDLRIDPYSMRHQTPMQRSQELIGMMKEVILPMLPIAAQQGVGIDMNKFLTKIAELRDQPDLTDIVTVAEPPTQQGSAPEEPGMPQSTERTYTRRSMGGDQSQGSQQNDAQNFFAAEAANDGE